MKINRGISTYVGKSIIEIKKNIEFLMEVQLLHQKKILIKKYGCTLVTLALVGCQS